jgi:hypothetical protein
MSIPNQKLGTEPDYFYIIKRLKAYHYLLNLWDWRGFLFLGGMENHVIARRNDEAITNGTGEMNVCKPQAERMR